jgi:hypothetical protein
MGIWISNKCIIPSIKQLQYICWRDLERCSCQFNYWLVAILILAQYSTWSISMSRILSYEVKRENLDIIICGKLWRWAVLYEWIAKIAIWLMYSCPSLLRSTCFALLCPHFECLIHCLLVDDFVKISLQNKIRVRQKYQDAQCRIIEF